MNVAVTFSFVSMVMVHTLPEAESHPVQESKTPVPSVAVKTTIIPLSYQHPAEQSGLMLPEPAGLTDVVS